MTFPTVAYGNIKLENMTEDDLDIIPGIMEKAFKVYQLIQDGPQDEAIAAVQAALPGVVVSDEAKTPEDLSVPFWEASQAPAEQPKAAAKNPWQRDSAPASTVEPEVPANLNLFG